MQQKDRDALKDKIALFRYGLISSLVNGTYEDTSLEEYYRKTAPKTYTLFDKQIKVQPSTIKSWYINYKKWAMRV